MKEKTALLIKRVIMSVIGVSLLGVCVALLRKADFGTDPFTCFVVGIANVCHSTYGIIYPIVIGVLLVIVFFLNKHYIGLATVLNLFLVGTVGDIAFKIINNLYDANTIPVRIITLVIALIILCFASSLYITADLGVSSYDAISLIVSDKKIKFLQYRVCRIITDLICVSVGFLFHATIGVGTVITAFCMGPLTQFFNTYVAEKMLYGKNGKPKVQEAKS